MHLLANILVTPDGTELRSYNRHDYKTHVDANGKEYMIDGGLSYIRCSANGDEKFITITTDDPFDVQREFFVWGTYGKEGKDPLKYVALKDLEVDHINAIVETQHQIPSYIRALFETELEYRSKN